jgi:nucleoside-diphosphate-sugar epimerase
MEAVPDSVALRASVVVGARSRSFRFLVRLVERLPVIVLPAWRRFRTQPIDERDVLEMLLGCATAQSVAGLTLDVGGPQILTYEQIVERIAELMLVGRPTIGLGLNATPIAARVAAALTGEQAELFLPLMEGLGTDLLAGDSRAAELLEVSLHSFDAAVEHALREWERNEPLAAR